MAATFVSLPLPALNGPGTSVDVSTIAANKTVVVSGSLNGAVIDIEASVDGGIEWAPLVSFQATETKYVTVAALKMRANVKGRTLVLPFSAAVGVGGVTITAATAINLPMPAMNGPGTAVLASSLASVKTAIVGGDFNGVTITVEASQDGGTSFAPVGQFANRTGSITIPGLEAEYLRVNVSGRSAPVPFTATLDVGAADGGGGGGGSSVLAFTYTATGLEGDVFTVTLPTSMPSADYVVVHTLGECESFLAVKIPDGIGDRTVNDFICEISLGVLAAGDTIDFIVTERS